MCFENVPHKAFYSGKNGVWNDSQTIWDIFQTFAIIVENFPSYIYETLATYTRGCLCMHALAHIHRPLPTCIGPGPIWSFYFQKYIFAHLKGYVSILTLLKSI